MRPMVVVVLVRPVRTRRLLSVVPRAGRSFVGCPWKIAPAGRNIVAGRRGNGRPRGPVQGQFDWAHKMFQPDRTGFSPLMVTLIFAAYVGVLRSPPAVPAQQCSAAEESEIPGPCTSRCPARSGACRPPSATCPPRRQGAHRIRRGHAHVAERGRPGHEADIW